MKIKESPSGKIITTLKGYQAFIPAPLPIKLEWNDELVRTLSIADHILGRLCEEGSKLPNPHLLLRPFIVREAVFSSKIEGTQATLGEVLANEAGARVDRNLTDLQEVQNYIIALDYGIEKLNSFPLSLRLIREMHEKLLEGVRGGHATPGEFRWTQNWIGKPGSSLATAKYVPPPPEEMRECLSNLEFFLHDRTLPALIHAALSHYQFEAIHPFLDGNGRIGRLLIILLLVERNIIPSPILYLSAYFEATRQEYYTQLFNVSSKGTWNSWLIYFLRGVTLQSQDVLSRAERINSLIQQWQLSVGTSKTLQDSIKLFAINPYLTAKNIADNLKVSPATANRAIQKLRNLNIVEETTKGKRGRVYCATKILAILEEPTKINQFFD